MRGFTTFLLTTALGAGLVFSGYEIAPAQVRISSLPSAAPLTGAELIPAVQGGSDVVLTPSGLLAFVDAGLISGPPTAGHCVSWASATKVQDAGSACGGGATGPGGSPGQLEYDNAGVFGGFSLAGDCTLAIPNITCSKTGGVAFAPSATTDATNASNLSTGVLAIARGGTGAGSTSQGYVFAGPTAGSGAPSFRALTTGDVPALSGIYCAVAGCSLGGELITLASASGGSGLNLPQGAAPTSPNNGDLWATSAGLYVQIAGATVGPLGPAGWSPTYLSGNWYVPPYTTVALGNAVTAGTLYCSPFPVVAPVTIKTLGAYVVTAGSSNVQFAIYANGAGETPNGPALVTTASAADTSTGVIAAATSPTTYTLSVGTYWACSNSNDSTAHYTAVANTSAREADMAGAASEGSVLGSGVVGTGLTLSQAFGTWPSVSASSGWSVLTATKSPVLAFQVN